MSFLSVVPPISPIQAWMEYCNERGLTDEILAPLNGQVLSIERAARMMGTGLYGFKSFGAIGAYVFYVAKDELQARILYGPAPETPSVGEELKNVKRVKYFRPKQSTNVLFVPPHLTDWYADTTYNLLIVEGALNATRLAAEGFHAIAITGVYNYREKGKGSPIIRELAKLVCSRQAEKVTILFDSDTGEENRQLEIGTHLFAQDMVSIRNQRSDSIFLCRPPSKPDGTKNGPDDYLHQAGIDQFNKLLRERSECYIDDPFLVVERKAVARFIYEELSGCYFDCKIRTLIKEDHTNRSLAFDYGNVLNIKNKLANGPYTTKLLANAPNRRVARGMRYQPDRDEIHFSDDSVYPPVWYINKFQPEDVPQSIKGDVSIAYDMMNSICRNTPEAIQKLLQIVAKHAQYPALTPKYGILLTGEQGSGKSNLAKLIGLSLSKRYHSSRVDLKIGFNAEWRSFACKEWAEFDRDMDEEWLKDLITGDTYNVSTKYGANYVDNNHTLNIFTCNGLQAKLQKGDRRFLVCGEAKSDNKKLGLAFESWIKGVGPNHFRYHLLNEIDCSNYDNLDVDTELKDAVIEASQSYRSTVKDFVMEECAEVPGLECIPNVILQGLLDVHKVNAISFNKEFGQYFIKPKIEVVKIDGVLYRFRAFANHDKWKKCDDTEEYRKQFYLAQKLIRTSKY